MSTAAVRAKGEAEFFGPLLPSRWPWFAQHGGWEGVARVARNLSIEVGHVSWRTEGWAALQASSAGAALVTKPLAAREPAGCANLSLSANYRGGAARVELLDASRAPLAGYAGADAAHLAEGADGVAVPLRFGRGGLPKEVRGAGVRVRVEMGAAGAQLFGVSLRCDDFGRVHTRRARKIRL